ncbi:hypothetical protein GCM10010191_74540 [Actinomadura vinacea]|uniref:Guanylate cyclase domain-containing protein n=1 Tax=Actinomadura vinacea TaxID=115336 RepID=A0ABN3K4T9_9ACTN
MTDGGAIVRRLLMFVDATGYGRSVGRRQEAIQNGLVKVLDEAAARTGLRRAEWARQPAGDGELSVLPPDEPEDRVVESFPQELAAALRRHNRDLRDEAKLRLRLAVHYGPARPAVNGHTGAGPVTVSRLCDSEPLRAALARSGADLAVVFSRQIFNDTILQEHTDLEPGRLRKVRVLVKEFDEEAWIWIPGHDSSAFPAADPALEAGRPARGDGFHRGVTIDARSIAPE